MYPICLRELLACTLGVLIGGLLTYSFITKDVVDDEKYHIHADFLIQVNDDVVELGVAELMTTATKQLHEHAHLHDENGKVLHMHEEGISFVTFLSSLGITLTKDCLTLKDGKNFCAGEVESLKLYVNGEAWTADIESYIPTDLDRILIYYGDTESSPISNYLEAIPNDACLYSGSCPERGTAPPESCGLTCEL